MGERETVYEMTNVTCSHVPLPLPHTHDANWFEAWTFIYLPLPHVAFACFPFPADIVCMCTLLILAGAGRTLGDIFIMLRANIGTRTTGSMCCSASLCVGANASIGSALMRIAYVQTKKLIESTNPSATYKWTESIDYYCRYSGGKGAIERGKSRKFTHRWTAIRPMLINVHCAERAG